MVWHKLEALGKGRGRKCGQPGGYFKVRFTPKLNNQIEKFVWKL